MDRIARDTREVLARHGRSFHFASYFLGREMRDDAALAYAFCRRVDDAVDEATSPQKADRALQRIEEMLDGRRQPDDVTRAYLSMVKRLRIGLEPAQALLAGARSDITEVRVRTDQDLALYCYRVAGTVGLMMCGILGVQGREARRSAIDLGMAMQLTNIARDVLEDAQMNRVYLPEKRLLAAGTSQAELTSELTSELRSTGVGAAGSPSANPGPVAPAVTQVVRQLLLAAELTYESAAQGFRFLPARPRLAIMVASALYREIGRRLLSVQGGDPLRGRVVVPPHVKLRLAGKTTIEWFRSLLALSTPLVGPTQRQLAPHTD